MKQPKRTEEPAASELARTDAKTEAKADDKPKRQDGTRETVESIVIAFVLAFLFRTFEAEAFVIPTGSMAPTLQGRHKDVECPQCGTFFRFGASDEVDNDGWLTPHNRITAAACPNCRYVTDVEDLPVFKGDRILVTKFTYEFTDPRRWDVAVFKYPEDPTTNYIKRLVGLPGETLEIRQGDLYRIHENGSAEILRKDDPYKQRELQILVYDNDRPERLLHEHGWPERWAAVSKDDAPGSLAGWSEDASGWIADPQARSFELPLERARNGHRWIRYRHFVPTQSDWDAVAGDRPRAPNPDPRPQIITDFTGYNAFSIGWGEPDPGLYWVGDLTLSLRAEVEDVADGAELLLELNEGHRRYRCRIDLADGEATLYYPSDLRRAENGDEDIEILGRAGTPVRGRGRYDITFANVDDRLSLWINGRLIDFGTDEAGRDRTEYPPFGGLPIQMPQEEDLVPVGVAARNAAVQVSRLLLERDIYYRGEFIREQDFQNHNPRRPLYSEYQGDEGALRRLVHDPQAWGEQFAGSLLRDDPHVDPSAWQFRLGPDEFFMLGDNSPRSKDSRLWSNIRRAENRHAVPRSALVGKAFFIYWPHGIPFLNDGRGFPDDGASLLNNRLTARLFFHQQPRVDHQGRIVGVRTTDYPSFRIPFYPNVFRMHRIR